MRKILVIFLAVILVLCSVSPIESCGKEEINDSELYSLSAALIDGDTGRVLYEKNGYEIRAMASTTKIMTLILALEYGNLDDMVTVSSYASKMPDVQLNIKENEQYKLEDLMFSLILESHNDSAVAIAEHVGGSVEGFAVMMNKKAMELGLSHTYFITPNGLDAADNKGKHSTNAVELSLLMKYCVMESPMKDEFIRICQTREHTFSDYDNTRVHNVQNKNAFLNMMDGVLAGKTGFTADAGYCYVAALTKENKTYIVALLGCGWPGNKNYKWKDSRYLFEYGIENYNFECIFNKASCNVMIPVIDGKGKEVVHTIIRDDINCLMSVDDKLEFVYDIPDKLSAPVKKGDVVGGIDIYINDKLFTRVNIYSAEYIEKKDFKYYMRKVFSFYF